MENKTKTLHKAKIKFKGLKTDQKIVLFSAEKLNMRLLKKLKQSAYSKEKLLLKLIDLIENGIGQINQTKVDQTPARLDYSEKREIDRSTLRSFDGPFQIVHADIASLEFLRKSATVSKYALLIVDLSHQRFMFIQCVLENNCLKHLKKLYDEVQEKEKKKNMRLQVENEFQQVKIKDLNVTVFMTNIRGRKAFAVKQNIRELKTRISMLKAISDKNKAQIPPKYIIKQSVENMNNVRSEKYNISPNEIKKRSLASKQFKTLFNFERIKKSKQIPDRLDKYDKKIR